MFGWIHCSLKMMLGRRHGEDVWNRVMTLGDFGEMDMANMNRYYDDQQTFRIVSCASNTLGVPIDDIWEAYGCFLINFTMETGWDQLLRALAPDIEGFLQTLDALHYFIDRVVYQAHLQGPSFRVQAGDKQKGGLLLHYYSRRKGLYPIVKGVVREIAKQIFEIDIVVRVLERKQETLEDDSLQVQEHVTFRVNTTKDEDGVKMSLRRYEKKLDPTRFGQMQIQLRDFVRVFPLHICFDRELRLKHYGFFIKKSFPFVIKEETKISDVMELVFPEVPLDFETIINFINGVFVFKLRSDIVETDKPIFLKGQMCPLEDADTPTGHMVYACSLNCATVVDLLERNLHLSDLPMHDATRDLILLNQSRMSQVELNLRLEETKAEMKRMAETVREEQEKTDALLSELMPPTISQALRTGKSVPAADFETSTILFSDIVSFTNLCAATTPIGVVDLLNDLYKRFDRLTGLNNTYKVETIGDAYMVVGGVPDVCSDHAAKVCNMALGMLYETKHVPSPVDGNPIQVSFITFC